MLNKLWNQNRNSDEVFFLQDSVHLSFEFILDSGLFYMALNKTLRYMIIFLMLSLIYWIIKTGLIYFSQKHNILDRALCCYDSSSVKSISQLTKKGINIFLSYCKVGKSGLVARIFFSCLCIECFHIWFICSKNYLKVNVFIQCFLQKLRTF